MAAKTAKKATRRKAPAPATMTPVYATALATKRVWLTFDDGPHPANTDKVLATLAQHGIKATFFVVGENVKARKPVVQRVFDAGHRIGNHSYSHPNLTTLTDAQIRDQIVKTEALISSLSRQGEGIPAAIRRAQRPRRQAHQPARLSQHLLERRHRGLEQEEPADRMDHAGHQSDQGSRRLPRVEP